MARRIVVAALVAALAIALAAAQEDESLVTTQQGVVQGVVEETHRVFYGIPFAAPPVGDLRWRAPQAPASWTGVRDATYRRPDCIQLEPDRRWFGETSEDCLYLNVWAPRGANATEPVHPVLFFIHGGSNFNGGSSVPIYNGRGIVELTQNAVVVVINYRLNVFGFLGGAQLAAESDEGANGNYAVLDQRAALVWVRDNIAAFGGNASRVMIFGESAGSWDVQYHLVFPRSAGLFVAAAMESGASEYTISQLTQEEANANFDAFAASLGCANLTCLRAIPAFELGRRTDLGDYRWMATIDNVELHGRVSELVAAGAFTRVPLIIGSNEDEIPSDEPRDMTVEEYEAAVIAELGPEDGAAVLAVYPASDYASPWYAHQQVLSDAYFTCVVLRNAKWMAPFTPTYAYYFVHTPGLIDKWTPWYGAFHGTEIPFVMNFHSLFTVPEDHAVAEHMVTYWTNLAHTGNPNAGPRAPPVQWPTLDTAGSSYVHLVIGPQPYLYEALKAEQCAVWETIYPNMAGRARRRLADVDRAAGRLVDVLKQ